jgi:hypothetical protein
MIAVMCERHNSSGQFGLFQCTRIFTLRFVLIVALFSGCSVYDDLSLDAPNGAGRGGQSNDSRKPWMDGATESAVVGNESGTDRSGSDSGRSDSGFIEDSGTSGGGVGGRAGGGGRGKGGSGGVVSGSGGASAGSGASGNGGASAGAGNTGGTGVKCSEEGGKVWPENGHCYFPSKDSLSWYVSRDNCKNVGANLATITSATEQFFINSFVDTTTSRWIGLCNFGADHFSWISGEPVSYQNWETTEPTPSAGSGVIVQSATFKWLDKPVDDLYPAVCERQ